MESASQQAQLAKAHLLSKHKHNSWILHLQLHIQRNCEAKIATTVLRWKGHL